MFAWLCNANGTVAFLREVASCGLVDAGWKSCLMICSISMQMNVLSC